MNKAILIMDMPDSCEQCDISSMDKHGIYWCSYLGAGRPVTCPGHKLEMCPLKNYEQKWISVDDRLPDKPGSYLVIGKTGGATVTRWYPPSEYNDYKGHFGGNRRDYIRYWMPRPEPPERGDAE